jgi:tetratricopeptide (TPR) repeat protein
MKSVAAALAVTLLATNAHAEDKDKARAAYLRATQHYELGEYRHALDAFKDAYRNFGDPAFLFDLAQCHRQLGDNEQAIREYRMYLVKLPDAPNQTVVLDLIAKLERATAQKDSAPAEKEPAAASTPTLAAIPTSITVTPTVQPKATPRRTPLYEKWWLWSAVGAAVAAVGVGVGVSQRNATPTATTNLGTFRF